MSTLQHSNLFSLFLFLHFSSTLRLMTVQLGKWILCLCRKLYVSHEEAASSGDSDESTLIFVCGGKSQLYFAPMDRHMCSSHVCGAHTISYAKEINMLEFYCP